MERLGKYDNTTAVEQLGTLRLATKLGFMLSNPGTSTVTFH